MSRRGPKLEFSVARRAQLEQSVVAAVVDLEARYGLRVAAIESLRQPQHGRQLANRATPLPFEVAVVLVAALGRRLTMVASNQRDGFDFLRIEPAQVPILDQIVRVFVMALVANVDTDVVEDSRVFEPLALVIGHAVNASRLVEQYRRQARNLLRVLGPVVAALGEFEHAAPPDVGIAIGLRDLFAVFGDVIENQPFTQ